jgi:hypothetical protein
MYVWLVTNKTFLQPVMFSAQEAHFHNSTVNYVVGDQQNTSHTSHVIDDKALAALKPATRDWYDVPRCMERTRESVFREIDLWLDGKSLFN